MPDVKIGDVVTIADIEWIVLDKKDDAVLCLTKDHVNKDVFDRRNNNYATSYVRSWLNTDFLQTITRKVGEDALFDVEIDLTACDGSKEYGCVVDRVGLLTLDMYKAYSDIIMRFPLDCWCWTATAHSTLERGQKDYVFFFERNGSVSYGWNSDIDSIRPFCVFRASVIESN